MRSSALWAWGVGRVTPDPSGGREVPACEELRGPSLAFLWGSVCFFAFFIDLVFS